MNFLKRRGHYFRANAQGYTDDILEAGVFDDNQAKQHLGCTTNTSTSVEIIPIEDEFSEAAQRLDQANRDLAAAEMLMGVISDQAKSKAAARCPDTPDMFGASQ